MDIDSIQTLLNQDFRSVSKIILKFIKIYILFIFSIFLLKIHKFVEIIFIYKQLYKLMEYCIKKIVCSPNVFKKRK